MSWEIVDAAAAGVPWPDLKEMAGSAAHVPETLKALLSATTKEERKEQYWKLENRVVVQGHLFESAVPFVPLLLAALLEGDLKLPAKRAVLELLFQIVRGESYASEAEAGQADLGERCRNVARQGIWLLYRELIHGDAVEQAEELLRILEPDQARLERMHALSRSSGDGADP